MRKTEAGAKRRTIALPVPGAPPSPRVPRPERWTLSNGLRVLAVPRSTIPQVAIRLVFPAGAVGDPAGLPGTAALVGSLLTEGTARFSAEELNLELDYLGAAVSARAGHDFAEIDLFLLSETLAEGMGLLAELLVPSFPGAEVERARAETLDALDARDDEPANVADDRVALELFGPDHPYGRLAAGTPAGVAAVDRDALAAFHAEHFLPEGSVLIIAGDFETGSLRPLLETALGQWRGRAVPLTYPAPPTAPRLAGECIRLDWPDAAQGEIRLAGAGIPRSSEDWIPASVANYLLGGSTITGRLGANLREDKGWTYGIRSGFSAAVQAGGWVIGTAVDAEVVDAALTEIQRELDRFLNEPVSAEELARAQDALVLSLPRAFETPGRILGRLATMEMYGLSPDYWDEFPERVRAVTREEVLRIARAYFRPETLVRVTVGTQ